MLDTRGVAISARLDRLPATRYIWTLVTLISIGGFFEFYDLFLTGYVVPGLVRDGLLSHVSVGIFTGPAAFVAATFAGLWVGTLALGFVADRFGRRRVFTISLLWYCAATFVMAFQQTGFGVILWRAIAGIGIGVELVTIDTYIAELVPKSVRGRAFAYNQSVQFAMVPIVALLAYLLVPTAPFGIAGWRLVVIGGSAGAIAVWFIRRGVPESPRWLLQQNRVEEAERVTAMMEARVAADLRGPLPPPLANAAEDLHRPGRFADIWVPPYRQRTIMMAVFQFFQTIGFYGFASWVPTLLAQKGINLSSSLLYSFIIALANPFGPGLAMLIADRVQVKWMVVGAALCIAVFGMLFAAQNTVGMVLLFGVLLTLSTSILSMGTHAYQSELFPTRVRGRAVGFVYSFSRLSTIFVSFMIAFFLQHGGVPAVFLFIAGAMVVVMISIGVFGPNTRNLQLEAISH